MAMKKVLGGKARLAANASKLVRRSYAVQAPGTSAVEVFDIHHKWLHRERAATFQETSRMTDYLRDEVAVRLCDRLLDINRQFPKVLDFGANSCHIAKALARPNPDQESDKKFNEPIAKRVGQLVAADTSEKMLYRDAGQDWEKEINMERIVLSSPEYVPYEEETFDLVVSNGSLHWINDLPSVLTQINRCLKPDAPFLGAMAGGDTLFELRGALQLAEQDRLGGIAQHISPLADVRDVGNLLSRAGFKLLTVDVDDIVVNYPNVFALIADLQAMGDANAALRRTLAPLNRDVLLAVESIYREMYGETQEDGTVTIPATFRNIYMIGWREGGNQPQPLERGTGQANLTDVLGGGGKIG
ncbi:S-adenosyl-L-methionine-dependent methyltransferase [Polychaeton citri CBS 116435]|uniref:S-adenosyl-L-methionine-dependent methyltransferase n=1 Tax=Polychaeton citri CBS 116435 TaxID=1314669 RepID=A0A9P4UNJ3_9PEZI|nr:S-adenosyl-L-methionine-dependent methyltransferase [Polychaeton citri CBS 116435]